ncbi:hypothetical protein Y710_00305 [Gordonia sp. QH-12]|uniref:hypothetical protein n=1 Tax=Gordonia sp. QH-12 TaxID=1437876 RepID=UPI000784D2A6|nr:hypothetical protein [Gordonia sp. QH-12]KXT58726.1 hypothetical protein Y710_00305 [Gordonia sp. QH-12]
MTAVLDDTVEGINNPWSSDFVPEHLRGDRTPEVVELPTINTPVPLKGNGLSAIRDWVVAVERHFGAGQRATVQYASFLGYFVNLYTFRVERSDRALARELGAHRDRFNGCASRLAEAGFLVKIPKKPGEKGVGYVLSMPSEIAL